MRTLIDQPSLAARVAALGQQINADYADSELVVVPVLRGSFVFAADLVRHLTVDVEVDFLGLRSYLDGTESSGVVQITSDLSRSIEDREVLVVEDIVDTGLTMAYLFDNLETRRPRSLRLASLLHKPSRTRTPIPIDYLGFQIDDVFVVGYGLDYQNKYRNLPYLAVMDEEVRAS